MFAVVNVALGTNACPITFGSADSLNLVISLSLGLST